MNHEMNHEMSTGLDLNEDFAGRPQLSEKCSWCGKPFTDDLTCRLEYPISCHGKDYCPSCYQQMINNTKAY